MLLSPGKNLDADQLQSKHASISSIIVKCKGLDCFNYPPTPTLYVYLIEPCHIIKSRRVRLFLSLGTRPFLAMLRPVHQP